MRQLLLIYIVEKTNLHFESLFLNLNIVKKSDFHFELTFVYFINIEKPVFLLLIPNILSCLLLAAQYHFYIGGGLHKLFQSHISGVSKWHRWIGSLDR